MNFSLKQKKRSAVSPVIATLLLIAIAVAAAIIVYAFVTGLIGGLSSSGTSNLVTVSGNLLVPSSTTGTLVLNIKNSANNPISSIVAAFPVAANGLSSQFTGPAAADVCFGTVAACGPLAVNFQYNGAALTATNPLPVGAETSAVTTVSQTGSGLLQSGNTYAIAITVNFASGSPQIQLVSLTAVQ